MNRGDVAITGLGLITAAGVGVRESWTGLLSGRPTARSDPLLEGLPVDFSCQVPDLKAESRLGYRLNRRLDPFAVMALLAAREAVADAGFDTDTWQADRVAVVMGVAASSMDRWPAEYGRMAAGQARRVSPLTLPRSLPNMVAAEIALDLGARGPNLVTSSACSSGATAIGVARALLLTGACDVALAGGSESARSRMTATGFAQMRALSSRNTDPAAASRPFDRDRDGFVLGEGAGILVLERAEHAAARAARRRAYLTGYGASCDAHHPTAPSPGGEGAVRAIRAALAEAGAAPEDIGHVNAHGTSTVLNDLAEYQALKSVFRLPPPVTAVKSVIGHAIGGAGAIEAAVAVLTLQNQTIPPTANIDRLDPEIDLEVVSGTARQTRMTHVLSNSFGFGGQNAVLVFRAA